MKNTTQMAMAVALLMGAAACHKDNKEAQMKALDNAYKSGVFTKEEYDAKKQALLGTPPAPAAAPASAAAVPPANPPGDAPPDSSGVPGAGGAPASEPPVAAAPPPAQLPPSTPAQPPRSPAPRSAVAPPAPEPPLPAPPLAQAQPKAAPRTGGAEPEETEPAPLAGCRDAGSRAGGPNGVQERFFPVSVEAVRKAATLAFTNLDFTVHSDSGHEMEASKRRHLSAVIGAGGERLILHFANAKQGVQSGTRVTAETKKSIVGRLAQKSWTTAVLAQISCNLGTGR